MGVTRLANPTSPTAGELRSLLAPIQNDLRQVEDLLAQQTAAFEPALRGQMQYVLTGTGKRLRPALALLAGGATGAITETHRVVAVIVELIHLATLVHDDVLDDAMLRHAQPTANARWGNTISILLGDCLFARALQLAATHTSSAVCRRISEAANTVCTGEILQNQRSFDLHLPLEQYLDIIHRKTGALFGLSTEVGATLNAAAPTVVEQLHEFGDQLGTAYQIYDDCVDVLDREDRAGKSLGTDMKKGKLTLPFLLLLQHTPADRRAELGEVIFHGTPADRQRLLQLALSNGVVAESLLTIDRHVSRAESQLAGLPVNPHSESLAGLLAFVAGRSRQLWQEAGAR